MIDEPQELNLFGDNCIISGEPTVVYTDFIGEAGAYSYNWSYISHDPNDDWHYLIVPNLPTLQLPNIGESILVKLEVVHNIAGCSVSAEFTNRIG